MARFEITLLGCGSATLTLRHAASAQVVDVHDKLYLIDCGEGTQLQMHRMQIRLNRLEHIFISHLHGDHCFGLPGLISTLGMLGREKTLVIHGPPALEDFLCPLLAVFGKELPYSVSLHLIDPLRHAPIMEDQSLSVWSIPLKHGIPTCGYLFVEKPGESHLLREMVDFYRIPPKTLTSIKRGADYVTPEGEKIPNSCLTRPADPPKRYAYCSDTAFAPEIVPWIEGVDCLYHEATFMEPDLPRARETFHSTARQAAEIARRAQVKQLVLGHYSARYKDLTPLVAEAAAVFPETVAGEEGMKLSLIKKDSFVQ